jgi:hypothetical protein
MSLLKTLAIAAVAVTSLGAGSAMAQGCGYTVPGNACGAYNLFGPHPAAGPSATSATNVQAGSSDTNGRWSGTGAYTDSPYFSGGNGSGAGE